MKNLLAALAIGSLAVPALAQDTSAVVEYRDLDLATAEGQKTLDVRIDAAAKAVCQYDDVTVGSRMRSRETKACYAEAKRKLKQQFAAVVREAEKGG